MAPRKARPDPGLPAAERSYRRSVELLEPLAAAAGAGHDVKQSLARTRTLLADLLVRRGTDKDKAGPLYARALEAQRILADAKLDPAAGAEDFLRLGQTYKSQGDLLRLDGKFAHLRPVRLNNEASVRARFKHELSPWPRLAA